MLKFLIIQLCDSSVSFCHYPAGSKRCLIQLRVLENGLLWAVKHSLDIHIVFPGYNLPEEYIALLAKYDYISIAPHLSEDSDVAVLQGWTDLSGIHKSEPRPMVLHTSIAEFLSQYPRLGDKLHLFDRINVVFSDVLNFSDDDMGAYERVLGYLSDKLIACYNMGRQVQFNLLTDRARLTAMNNCNAGVESITLSPDGNFYICPGFYLSEKMCAGSPDAGVAFPNNRLCKLEYAPICRQCDAFHCKRCLWLNQLSTLEINTPSHQQCIMAHIERKVAGRMLSQFMDCGIAVPDVSISELTYEDPFEKIIRKDL